MNKTRSIVECSLLVSRLSQYITLRDVCNYIGIRLEDLYQMNRVKPSNVWKEETDRDLQYHLQKIKYYVQNGISEPIDIDNLSMNGSVVKWPVIIDGRHRYLAALLRRDTYIPCTYSGDSELLAYLTGEITQKPL